MNILHLCTLTFFLEACLGCVWRCHVMFSSCQQYYLIYCSFLYLCWLHLLKLTAENWLNLNFENVEPYMITSNLIIPRDRDFRHGQAASWPMRRVVSNILYFTILDDSLFVHHTALRHAAAAAHAQCSAALLLPNRSRMFEQQRRRVWTPWPVHWSTGTGEETRGFVVWMVVVTSLVPPPSI